MGKENKTQRRIDLVFKRKRDDITQVEEDHVLPLLELDQQQPEQQHNQDGGVRTNEVVTFRGIEFLQRDPGLRPQIWQYPPDQRDTVRRAYLMLGPMQPRLENYKPSGEPGHQRRFQYSWFGDFPSWLEYSEDKSCAYCLYCFVSSNKENTRGGSHVFTVHGFDSWKRVCGKHCAFACTHHMKQCLQELRSDDGYQVFITTVVEFCVNHSIDIPDFEETYIMRGGRARRQPDQFTKEHYFRVEIFFSTLDTQLFELNRRFNEKVMDLLTISATLIPRNKFRGFKASDICEMVKKYYPADFPQDIYGLQQQLKHFVSDASKDDDLKNISTLIDLCRCLVETGRDTVYNLIDRLLRLLITLPVSTASAERAFSSMKIIKTRLRNKMEDENLANNLLVHIEGGILENYNHEDVIADFISKKDRRVDF